MSPSILGLLSPAELAAQHVEGLLETSSGGVRIETGLLSQLIEHPGGLEIVRVETLIATRLFEPDPAPLSIAFIKSSNTVSLLCDWLVWNGASAHRDYNMLLNRILDTIVINDVRGIFGASPVPRGREAELEADVPQDVGVGRRHEDGGKDERGAYFGLAAQV